MPVFKHDCENCIYLGSVHAAFSYDFYYCPTDNMMGGSCIIREGDEPDNYQSFPWDIVKMDEFDEGLWGLMRKFILTHEMLGTITI